MVEVGRECYSYLQGRYRWSYWSYPPHAPIINHNETHSVKENKEGGETKEEEKEGKTKEEGRRKRRQQKSRKICSEEEGDQCEWEDN